MGPPAEALGLQAGLGSVRVGLKSHSLGDDLFSMRRTGPTTPARFARAGILLLGVFLAVAACNAVLGLNAGPLRGFLEKWSYNVVLLGAALICTGRGLVGDSRRRVWFLLGGSMLLWSLGNVYYSVALWDKEIIPVPSWSDVFWIAFYPGAYLSLLKLLRYRTVTPGGGLWLDGAIGGLAIAAAAVAFVFDQLLIASGSDTLSVATNLAYPVADTALVMLTVAVIGLNGWQLQRGWLLLGLGFVTFGVIDSIYLVGVADGTWVPGNIGEAGWPLAMLLLASAAWAEPTDEETDRVYGMRLLLVPSLFAAIALWVLVYDHFIRVHVLALALATAALVLVIARMALTFRDNLRQLGEREQQALTDALTGLGNRRKLYADLADLPDNQTFLLVLFDLNGFKDYNDRFGHPAGDALLIRVGERLRDALNSSGHAYRLGGDEFCTLTSHAGGQEEAVSARLAAALSEQGEGFSIAASFGCATVDGGVSHPPDALRSADRQMYADKHRGRATAARQSADVLAKALRERNLDLSHHLDEVAHLARLVGNRIGMVAGDLEATVRAAELHDVGKVAIPDEILLKSGPLTASERTFIEQHTIMGERILAAAPALADVGRLVRHSHERFDGEGYPDRLEGEEIPLGSRVIHVCDAYEAMTSDRPYKRAMSVEAALSELRRCKYEQFDGAIVDVFCLLIEENAEEPRFSETPMGQAVAENFAEVLAGSESNTAI
jgi:two-component system, cell cycle response regulator